MDSGKRSKRRTGLCCIVVKVEAVGPEAFVTGLVLLENRFQFQRHIEQLKGK